MTGKWAFIEANDVLMFRDSKPFLAGANFTARSIFPPHPRTMQGFVRTHILESAGADYREFANGTSDPRLHEVVGKPNEFGTLALTGPFVARRTPDGRTERLFRAPFDLLRSKTSDRLSVLQPIRTTEVIANLPFENWRPLMRKITNPDEGGSAEAEGWLSETDFQRYLAGNISGGLLGDEQVYQVDTRVGLGLDEPTRRGKRGLFYHAEFVRPRHTADYRTGLLIGIENDQNLFAGGTANLGGEGRTVQIELIKFTPPSLQTNTRGRVKVVLLTPAWFGDGWQPLTLKDGQKIEGDWSTWVGGGELVSLAIGKPQLISGWNLAERKPRPIQHFLPAGSVFYFENATLTGKPFTEQPVDEDGYAAMGFGAYATGTWDYLD